MLARWATQAAVPLRRLFRGLFARTRHSTG